MIKNIVKIIVLIMFVLQVNMLFAKNIVVFGDSLSDAAPLNNPHQDAEGNNDWVQFCPSGASVCGDFYLQGAPISDLTKNKFPAFNGLVRVNWSNFLALNYPDSQDNSYLVTYRQLKEHPHDYPIGKPDFNNYNLNFASASAETGGNRKYEYADDLHGYNTSMAYNPYIPNSAITTPCTTAGQRSIDGALTSCVPGASQQIDDYLNLAPEHKASANNIYILWAGANDLFGNIGKLATLVQQGKYLDLATALLVVNEACNDLKFPSHVSVGGQVFSCAANNMAENVKTLVDNGATQTNVYVMGMPDLSLAPAAQAIPKFIVQDIANNFNNDISEKLKADKLNKVHIYPTYKAFDEIVENATKYGFSNAKDSCVAKHGNKDPSLNACYNYVFYNGKHPTGHAGECIASGIANYIHCTQLTSAKDCDTQHYQPFDAQCSLS